MKKDEQGYALVMVLFLILILTILGTAVMGAAINGAQQTETRESDVQGLHLAEKSLEGALASITAELSGKVNTDQKALDTAIQTYLQSIKPEDFLVSTELEAADGKITDISYIRDESSSQYAQYVLTIKAEAKVNGVVRKLEQEVIIDTFPDFLKYALGTEGNLILNGAPSITGNLYAGDQFWVSDTANYIYNSPRTARSQFPKLEGEAHIQSLSNLLYSENESAYQKVDASGDAVQIADRIQRVLGIRMDKVKIKNQREFVAINVRDSFVDKVMEAIGGGLGREQVESSLQGGTLGTHLSERYPSIFTTLVPEQLVKPIPPPEPFDDSDEEKERYAREMEEYELKMDAYQKSIEQLTQPKNSMVYNGNLELDGLERSGIVYPEDKKKDDIPVWLIVDGDLKIDSLGTAAIPVRANILVTGNVLIRGEANFDATIFSLGLKGSEPETGYSTVLQDASIGGLNGKELVMISQGAILINRVEAFQSTPTKLRAFFYTDEDAELYGVGSTVSIYGGFFAKETLTINAVVGGVTSGESQLNFNPLDNQSKPRFQVEYNPDIFENQKIGLPRVNQINVHSGKLKME